MTVDPRLLTVLEAAKVLDDPNVTQEQCARVRQLCSILAQSLDVGLPIGEGAPEWPDAAVKAAYILALTTSTYSDALSWPERHRLVALGDCQRVRVRAPS